MSEHLLICAACGETTATADRCGACGATPILEGRYRLEAVLGRGGAGITYRARRLTDDKAVCVKELNFHRMSSLEADKLFRREADILEQLDHPQIPDYVDDFSAGDGKSLSLYLVQELVEGETLAAELARHRYTEDEALDVVDEVLGVLEYLHALRPPVVHRDIKPGNVMRRAADGRLMLVDFGAVKDVARAATPGSTIAGTFGYMAPEQQWGSASPASDLYAAGVLTAVLLSRREPAEMLDGAYTLAWRPHVTATPGVVAWIDRMTRPTADERPADAAEARGLLAAARANGGALTAAAGAPGEATEGAGPHPARAGAAVALIALLLLGVAVLFLYLGQERYSEPVGYDHAAIASGAPEPPLPAACTGGACLPPTTLFKDKLRFGMSEREARAARTELAAAAGVPGYALSFYDDSDGANYHVPILAARAGRTDDDAVSMPGTRLKTAMSLAGEPSTCFFEFAVDGGLSRVYCALDGSAEAQQRVAAALLKRYGVPSERAGKHDLFGRDDAPAWDHLEWQSDEATLRFESTLSSAWVRQETAAHAALIVRLRDAQRAAAETQAEEARRKAEAVRRAAEEAIRDRDANDPL